MGNLNEDPIDELVRQANAARVHAYAPYSGYRVGAALESDDGSIFVGANMENVSFGATICAERAALCAMVVAGRRLVKRIVVSTDDGGFPCGICLQSLAEFSPPKLEIEIALVDASGKTRRLLLSDLAPQSFTSASVTRTGRPSE